MSCPWGAIQNTETLERGIAWVSTASHGGLRVAKGYAESILSDRCLAKATARDDNYYWYEEDVDWAYAILDLPHLWTTKMHYTEYVNDVPKHLLKVLSAYDPAYLEVKGIKPIPHLVVTYYAYKLQLALEAAGDPNAIRSACFTDTPGVTKVWTADGQIHYVTSDSYADKSKRVGGWLNLLSNCVEVPEPGTTDAEPTDSVLKVCQYE